MAHPKDALTLVADIGGTNTRCALAMGDNVLTGTVRRYRNADHPDLASAIRAFIADEGGVDPAAAAVAVAGPVRHGRAKLTNLAWTIDEATLAEATRAEKVAILNDLEAQGHALGHVAADNLRTILPFPPTDRQETRLVIGVGTGFNAAPVFHTPQGRLVAPSESGHVSLPVLSAADQRLAERAAAIHGYPEVEEILSGRGLEQLHRWLAEERGAKTSAGAAEIMAACAEGGDPQAEATVRAFVRILGAVAGDLALIQLPYGGVFLVGGVARAMAPYLESHGFAEGFRGKGRFSSLMETFGVAVVEDDFAALTGAAAYLTD